MLIPEKDYLIWLQELKRKIQSSQIKASLSVNQELINLYWQIGKAIADKQETQKWGSSVVEKLSKDLKKEFPNMTGFSRSNLFSMRQFYLFYKYSDEFVQQLVRQIPWGHIRLIFSKIKNIKEAVFYTQQSLENAWSRNILSIQIENDLYQRQGKAINNFETTLPKIQSDLANEILKDPYVFDFMLLKKDAKELEIELSLIDHITKFLLELGKGFAFIGRQYEIEINHKTYRIDLLFYHIKLRCFIVIELKVGEFKPEYIGKLNFYLSAIDDLLKHETDQATIGILLCKNKDKIDVEYSLRNIGKPIGVSEFIFSELPTIEEIEKELSIK